MNMIMTWLFDKYFKQSHLYTKKTLYYRISSPDSALAIRVHETILSQTRLCK